MTTRLRPNETDRARFIVNPHSAGGATGKRVDALRRSIDRYFAQADVVMTEGPGHASELATHAVADGVGVVVAVGGDGTASETVAGLFDGKKPRRHGVVFTVVPAGTGSDLIKSLGMPKDLDDAVRLAAFGPDRDGDAVHHQFIDDSGSLTERIGINVTGFGMNGDTVARANRGSKRLGGTLTFLGATLGSLARYSAPMVDTTWTTADGGEGEWSGKLLSCFIANGSWCGGGMCVAPQGSMTDGALDLTIIGDRSLRRTLALVPHLYRGTLASVPGVETARITALHAVSHEGGRAAIDIDGEQPGFLPLDVTILAKVVRLRGVW
jgi:diacylglycerol kinase (ATP)